MGSKCSLALDNNVFRVKIEVSCSQIFIEQASGRFRDECVTFHIGQPFTLRQPLTGNGKPVRVGKGGARIVCLHSLCRAVPHCD